MSWRGLTPQERARAVLRPEPNQLCTSPRGCDQPALPGRWSCREHADRLERRSEELQKGGRPSKRRAEEARERAHRLALEQWPQCRRCAAKDDLVVRDDGTLDPAAMVVLCRVCLAKWPTQEPAG
jgi:hypothetical protein